MCIPDLEIICEIMLMAEGFQTSKVNTSDLMVVSSGLLCGQTNMLMHADFGQKVCHSLQVV